MEAGGTPNLSMTPDSSRVVFSRRLSMTTLSERTHWARSLSGEHRTTWSTPAASAQRWAAAAMASSASNSTIGQTTMPSARTASSARWNWPLSAGSMPAPVL